MLEVQAEDLPRQRIGGTAYVSLGTGAPLILIHGVGMRADAWAPQIAHFASRRRVVALDMLGHGQSAAAPSEATLEDYAGQVLRLLDALDLDEASFAGHSMGALVCLAVASQAASRCRRFACLNAVYRRDPESKAAVQARAHSILTDTGANFSNTETMRRWFGDKPSAHEQAVARLTDGWLYDVSRAGYAAAYSVFADSDRSFEGRLGALRMPALFATGEFDPNSTPEMSRQMAAEAGQGRAEIVQGARHMMNLTHPKETNQLLERFLEE